MEEIDLKHTRTLHETASASLKQLSLFHSIKTHLGYQLPTICLIYTQLFSFR